MPSPAAHSTEDVPCAPCRHPQARPRPALLCGAGALPGAARLLGHWIQPNRTPSHPPTCHRGLPQTASFKLTCGGEAARASPMGLAASVQTVCWRSAAPPAGLPLCRTLQRAAWQLQARPRAPQAAPARRPSSRCRRKAQAAARRRLPACCLRITLRLAGGHFCSAWGQGDAGTGNGFALARSRPSQDEDRRGCACAGWLPGQGAAPCPLASHAADPRPPPLQPFASCSPTGCAIC